MRKILIANRGEIAVRVIRTCRDMGIETVAVYSEVDRDALHVIRADEAHAIGPAEPGASYLNIDRLLRVAERSGAEGVHPGYGFLAENADFSQAVLDAGLVWIGPTPQTIRDMGDKITARETATAAGVPPVPGATLTGNLERDVAVAERVGFPLMVKASGGGGGKGMRIVEEVSELRSAIDRAANEAEKAFGDSTVYVERAIRGARHVEVQVVGDGRGKVAVLGERDCSIQRRHQKLVEESACTALTPAARRQLWEKASALASRVCYAGAGTVEFLLDSKGETWFLEMNTRIQVEHPVTELVTGVDLVRQQISIAAGEPLSLDPYPRAIRGHAIECRIGAEDPIHGFLPAAGVIERLQEPGGPGVRIDSGVYPGFRVGLHYDPLLAKLIVWGRDRDHAVRRMARAIDEYRIYGVSTTLPFHRFVMQDEVFRAGHATTAFVQERMWQDSLDPAHDLALAAGLAAVLYRQERDHALEFRPQQRQNAESGWWLAREAWRQR
jgi:acetyl-CoA carboxylase biotin carboxylase subunit